jgi:hypothetical protein
VAILLDHTILSSSSKAVGAQFPLGETDFTVRTRDGGKNICWNCPDGHVSEILTISYDRMDWQD